MIEFNNFPFLIDSSNTYKLDSLGNSRFKGVRTDGNQCNMMESNILLPIGLIIPIEVHPEKTTESLGDERKLDEFHNFENMQQLSHYPTEVLYFLLS